MNGVGDQRDQVFFNSQKQHDFENDFVCALLPLPNKRASKRSTKAGMLLRNES